MCFCFQINVRTESSNRLLDQTLEMFIGVLFSYNDSERFRTKNVLNEKKQRM